MRSPSLAVLALLSAGALAARQAPSAIPLHNHWAIQSSASVRAAGEAISTPGFEARGWHATTVPSTVVSALARLKVYPDPYFGMNLRSIPGAAYPISQNFSNIPIPPDSPFRHSWWYRTEFQLPADYKAKTIWLHFGGINYRANVWLNGRQVANTEKMAGAWRLFDFNVTQMAQPGQANALAVEVFPPGPDDLAITFVDWNPQPPDKEMGLWREVTVSATGPVAIRFPQVITKLAGDAAALTVSAELHNGSGAAVQGTLKGKIEGLEFSRPVRLAAGESHVATFPPLKLDKPRLWWPAQVGAQNLYPLELQFDAEIGRAHV
jgi:exo-1,4-beta-D-glucosaminidase